MKKGKFGKKISLGRLIAFTFTIALLSRAPVELMADTTLQLGLTTPNVPAGTSQSAFLQWTAATDGIYKVQSNTNLDGSSPWVTEEPVQASVGPIRWMAPESIEKSKYYRLLLPQPDIFSVEPALLTTSGGTVYLTGQGLSTNGQMRVAGLVLPPNVLQPGSVYSFVVPTLPAGTYDVEWLVNGQVTATGYKLFSITAEVQPVGVAQRPYEIPQEPLASPDSSFARIKETGQWWAARSNKRGYVSGKFAIELDNFTTGEAQGGKKGLNAVNVKLASRVIGTRPLPAIGTGPNGQGLRLSGGGDSSEFVQACSGEVQVEAVDLIVPGRGLDFIWGRKYRSNVGKNYPTGNGWSFCYDVRCVQNGADMDVFDGSGRHDTYFHQTNGTFARDEFFNEGTLTKQVFRLTFPDTSFWVFNPFDGTAKAGKIAISQDRNGNALQFTYDSSGRLATVIDTLNRTNTIAYDSSGRIYSVTDFSGRSVTYQYYSSGNTNGNVDDLLSVTSPPVTGTPNGNDFPIGKTTTYTYSTGFTNDSENHLLLTVTDPKGQLVRSHIYQHNQTDLEFLRCISTTVGSSNEVETLCYVPQTPVPSNNFAVMRTIVNDCVGNVTECYYDARNRLLKLRQFTGRATPGVRATASANRPTGKLRAGDPDFFDSQWTWNVDSLWTMIQRPAGRSARMVHERDFDKNTAPRMKGNLRIYRELPCCDGADTDGDGVIDTTELTTTFQYDPRFGSPDMDCRTTSFPRKGWDGTIKGRFASGLRQTVSLDGTCCPSCRKGWDGTIKGNFAELDGTVDLAGSTRATSQQPKIIDNEKGLLVSFAIISSNPRGIATMRTYDPHGNPQECTVHWTVDTMAPDVMVTDYEYNQFGQMTACVNPVDGNGQRRRDQWSYYSSGPQTGYCSTWTVDATGPTVILSSYEYDAVGNITRCVDPMGNDTLCTYNSLNQLVRVQSPVAIGGTAIRYATTCFYDANDNPTHVSQENRDQTGVLGKPASFDVFYDFDVLNCVTQRTETIGGNSSAVTQMTYDACRQLSLVRSPECVAGYDPGNVVQCLWDERGLLYRCVRAPGTAAQSTDQVDYDSLGNRIYIYGGLESSSGARTTQYGYDGFERCVSVTDAMGNVATCAYDRNDNLVFSRNTGETNDVPGSAGNRRLSETHYEYDALDHCVTTRAAFFDPVSGLPLTDGEATTSCTYAQNGELTGMVDDNGHATHYAYDTVCRLSMITDAKSNTMVYAYDSNGNVLSCTQNDVSDLTPLTPQRFVSTCAYDGLNRCISSSDNVGNAVLYSYDSRDNCVRQIDANGNLTDCAYDALNRLIRTRADMDGDGFLNSPADISVTCTYDNNSRLTSTTDANGNPTSYGYDSLDRCTAVTNADATHSQFTYDPRDNVLTSTDPNGTVTTCTYDLLDRCIHKGIAPGTGVAATTTFELMQYDGLSRPVMLSNDVSRLTYSYDSLSDCVQASQDGLVTACSFDGVGNLLSMTYPGGRFVQYSYDGLDCLSTVSSRPLGGALLTHATYGYEGPDRLGRIIRANGVNTRINWNGLQSPANSAGDFGFQQVSRVNHAKIGVNPPIDQRVLAYDRNQNKTSRTQTTPFVNNQPMTTNVFSYSPINQLSRAINTKGTGAVARSYHLDGNGNRLDVTNGAAVEFYTSDAAVPVPADFQMNQYTLTPFGSEQHDRNGNRTQLDASSGTTLYQYDCDDRLVEVDRLTAGVTVPVETFTYDVLGCRLSKTTYPGVPVAPVTTYYVHGQSASSTDAMANKTGKQYRRLLAQQGMPGLCVAGGDDETDKDCGGPSILEERSSGAITRVYCWDGSCVTVAFDGAGHAQYYHGDDLGNVLALTDANGAVLERYDYDDFGAPSFLTSDGTPEVDSTGMALVQSAIGNDYLFHGMGWDGDGGLYYHTITVSPCGANRPTLFYDAQTGRDISRGRCPDGTCAGTACSLGGNSFSFSGNNPWSASAGDRRVTVNGSAAGSASGLRKAINTKGTGATVRLSGGAPGVVDCALGDILGGRSDVGNGSAGVFISKGTTSKKCAVGGTGIVGVWGSTLLTGGRCSANPGFTYSWTLTAPSGSSRRMNFFECWPAKFHQPSLR